MASLEADKVLALMNDLLPKELTYRAGMAFVARQKGVRAINETGYETTTSYAANPAYKNVWRIANLFYGR